MVPGPSTCMLADLDASAWCVNFACWQPKVHVEKHFEVERVFERITDCAGEEPMDRVRLNVARAKCRRKRVGLDH